MRKSASSLGLALLLGALPAAHATIDTLDNVPAATLLLPYFEVDTTSSTGMRTVFTVGNSTATERVAHVTLWTDLGVPSYSFNIRLAGYDIAEIDLYALFANGVLPQSTAGGFASCTGSLPPAALGSSVAAALRNAHLGSASSLLGNQCGSAVHADGHARGYATVDVTSGCTTLVPGDSGYFVLGGTGIARNDNVLWGEMSTFAPAGGIAYGDTLVHIEASASDPATDGTLGMSQTLPDYTFYGRLVNGTAADNREGLPQYYMGRYAKEGVFNGTTAVVWRDPGDVNPFACNSPPAALSSSPILAFDHQEEASTDSSVARFGRATQTLDLTDDGAAHIPFAKGFVYYDLQLGIGSAPFDRSNQGYVSHVFSSPGKDSAQSSAWALSPITENYNSIGTSISIGQCSDGIDNDGDGTTDFPADTGCYSATAYSESPQCSDGFDNDSDTFIDFPNDPSCASPSSVLEYTACSDGFDNDGDTFIDFPSDPNCTSATDLNESATPQQCSDGLDNDGDGAIDFPLDPQCGSVNDNLERIEQCRDGVDNDGDGRVDLLDIGCSAPGDDSETDPQCADGIDNDSDGRIDFPNDYGCSTRTDNFEAPNPQCSDGVDNDGDTLIDFPSDPGCVSPRGDERPQCNDGMDNDGDTFIDFPSDPGCASASSEREMPECSDTFDNDGDGQTDFPNDLGCTAVSDNSETAGDGSAQCNDGIDNDGDGLIDFPFENGCSDTFDTFEGPDCADDLDNDRDDLVDFSGASPDPGCASAADLNELANALTRACSDGVDNDGDGATDYPGDAGCSSAWDDLEYVPSAAAGGDVVPVPALSQLGLMIATLAIGWLGMLAFRRGAFRKE